MSERSPDHSHILELTSEKVVVKEIREAPFSEEQRPVPVETLDWDSFPGGKVTLDVVGGKPVKNDKNENKIDSIRLEISRLERHEQEQGRDAEKGSGFWQNVESEIGIRRRNDGTIALNGDFNAKDNLLTFVEYLFHNGLISKSDLPIKSGWKWHLVNDEAKHQNGDEMYQAEEIVDGVWIETKYSRDDIKKRILELGEKYGE